MASAKVPTNRAEMAQRVFPTARRRNRSTSRSGIQIATRRAGRIGNMSVSTRRVTAIRTADTIRPNTIRPVGVRSD